MRRTIVVFVAFGLIGFGNLYGDVPAMIPRVPLHGPFTNETDDVFLPTDGKPALVFPVSPATGLVRLDLIRAARLVRARFAERLKLVVVFVDVKNLDAQSMVDMVFEQRSLCRMGLGFDVEMTQLRDDSGAWYERLGRPSLPHALLVDPTGRILADAVLYGPLDWESLRIAALLDGKPVPPSPLVVDDTPRPPHPFYLALRDTPRVNGKMDWSGVVETMGRVDRARAIDVLQKFVVNTPYLDEARLVAQAALQQFGKNECAWARRLVNTHVAGTASSSLWELESMIRVSNPTKSHRMFVRVTTTLISAWDNSVVASFEPSAIIDPGSKVALFHKHFLEKNAGWGDYWAKHVMRVTMSRGEWPDTVEYPEFVRILEEHVVFSPRSEMCAEIDPQERDRTDDDLAFWDGYDEVSRELEKPRSLLGLLSFARLKNAWQDLARSTRQSLGKLWIPSTTPESSSLIGQPFPPIRIDRWVQGDEAFGKGVSSQVDSLGGKVVLLDFMFTGCPPCRRALPTLRRLQEQHRDEGFTVFSLCVTWGAQGLGRLVGNQELTHPVAVLAPGAEGSYAVQAFPTYVLIDRAGIVRWTGVGGEPVPAEIEKLLRPEDATP